MLISELNNRDEVLASVIHELNGVGIKIRSEKPKVSNNKRRNKKIFSVSLHNLELDDGLLANGSVAQIPKFVLHAVRKLQLEGLMTEGIFRKTGSVKKQKAIQAQLEKGGSLEKGHHVIDVANLLKTFFRDLPEPLIPPGPIQEALLRCLFHFQSYEQKCEALLMLMLLLPPISINTLAYFLQFLETVIKHSNVNLMSSDNLVKVLTPTIMPVPLNSPQQRLNSHFKVVELLIENANLLGVVPDRMCKKEHISIPPPMTEERKKKKRRSGSLNRVFHGFRRIVGAIGSSESLDKSTDKSNELLDEDPSLMTPNVTKSTKKRRLDKLDITVFSSKKKKEHQPMTLTSLPEIDDINSPSNKNDTLRTRKSYGILEESLSQSPTKRRCSVVGGKFTRSKALTATKADETPASVQETEVCVDEDYVKISKREYEAFKDRLISIETKITHEFNMTKLDSVKAEMGQNDSILLNGPEKVQNRYQKTLDEIEKLEDSERNTDQLAKRLSRDLKIDHSIMRSPSARKIGSLRRRRDSATRLSRNLSWHLGQQSPRKPVDELSSNFTATASFYPKSNLKRAKPIQTAVPRPLPALPSSAEKPEKVVPEKPLRVKRENSETPMKPETVTLKVIVRQQECWTPGVDFFKQADVPMETEKIVTADEMFFKTPVRPTRMSSARSTVKHENDFTKTPMLPPRITPAKKFTPTSNKTTPIRAADFPVINKHLLTPSMHDSSQGRESIITLRNKNAGMVAQKAKLFNGMSDNMNNIDQPIKIPRAFIVNKNLENVKCIAFEDTPSKKRHVPLASPRSPRRSSRSPSGINRRGFKATESPLLKTIRECSDSRRRLLKPDILSEIASPKRKPLSQSNTPRRKSKTPNRDSAKKRRQTPSKSPRFVRRMQSADSG